MKRFRKVSLKIFGLTAGVLLLVGIFLFITWRMSNQTSLKETSLSDISDHNSDIKISLERQQYKISDEEMHLEIQNTGTEPIEFGEDIFIEEYHNNTWCFDPNREYAFQMVLFQLMRQGKHTETVSFKALNLSKGKYRIIKEFTVDGNKVTLGTEFEIE